MIYISEEESSALVSHERAFEAARKALVAMALADSSIIPAVLGRTPDGINTFSIKSGASGTLTGVKVGSFWSGNPARGLPRHNSTIIFLERSPVGILADDLATADGAAPFVARSLRAAISRGHVRRAATAITA